MELNTLFDLLVGLLALGLFGLFVSSSVFVLIVVSDWISGMQFDWDFWKKK